MGKTGAKTKGYFKKLSGDKSVFIFQFNPNTIKTNRDTDYPQFQGCGSAYPNLQYVGGGMETISFTLPIFGSATKVKEAIKFLEGVMPPKDPLSKFAIPSLFYFSFGSSFTEKCVLTKMDKVHEEFDDSLATTTITFNIELKVIK